MDKIPLVDLRREYADIKGEVMPELERIVSAAKFIKGEDVASFEESYARICGVKHCVGLKSGTAALILSLKALKVEGDVVTVPNTFISTTEAASLNGLGVKFVDVDEKTHLMDLDKLAEAVDSKTGAVIPVHLYGQMVDVEAVREVVGDKVKVIEDAAQAHGATYGGKQPGAYSDCVCYSFYPAKNLGAYGDAGAVTTDDRGLYDLVYRLRDHGRGVKDKYEHRLEGCNERLDNLQAAVLNVKLKHLPDWIEKRRGNAKLYDKKLEGVGIPYVDPKAKHSYYFYVVSSKERDGLLSHLRENGVLAGVHYPIPLHLQQAYSHLGLKAGDYPVCERSCSEVLSLPCHPYLKKEEIQYVCDTVEDFV